MWSLPFLQPRHFQPLPLFYSEWLAAVLGLAALFVFVLPRYARELEVPWIAVTPLALIGVLVLHLALVKAAYPQQVFTAVLYLVWAAALMVLGALLRREIGLPRMSITLAWFLLAGGFLSAIAAMLQHYEARGFLESVIATRIGARAYGNLVQANHFTDYLVLAIASLLFLHARRQVALGVAVLFSCVLVFALALAGSASAWAYLAGVAVLAALLYLMDRRIEHRNLLVFAAVMLPAFALAQWLAQSPLSSAPAALETSTERLIGQIEGVATRLQLWRDAWIMFAQSPLLGAGHGQYIWHHFLLAQSLDAPPLSAYANHAHNIVLHLMAETGLLGTGVVAAGIALWLWGFRRIALGLDAWWLLVLLTILALHSMLEYPLWYAYFLGIAAVLLGAGEHRFLRWKSEQVVRVGSIGLLVVGWLSAASLIHNYYRLEVALFPQPGTATTAQRERAHRDLLSVHGSLLTPYVELALARALDLDTQNLDRKIEFSARVMRFAPTPVIAYQHAALLALKGDQAEAIRYLDHAVAAYPERLREYAIEFAALKGRSGAAVGAFQDRLRQHLQAQRRVAPVG